MPGLAVVSHPGIEFHDHVRAEDVRIARCQAVFGEAVALGEESHGARAAGHCVAFLLCNPSLAANEETVFVRRNKIEPEKLAPFRIFLYFLNLEVIVSAAD